MHSFLRTVGFSNITSRKELDKVLGLVMTHPTLDKHAFSSDDSHHKIIERSLDLMTCVLVLLSYFTCKTL